MDEIIFKTGNARNRLMLELMARGGMRIGEVLKLRVIDVDERKLTVANPKSGCQINVEVHATQILDSNGEVSDIMEYSIDVTARKSDEAALMEKTRELEAKIKDLNCFYEIGRFREKPGITLNELFMEVVDILRSSCQYPEVACSRIVLGGDAYQTDNFEEADWKLSSNITVQGTIAGTLSVYYLEERPERDERPFLKEERALFDAVVIRLGRIVDAAWVRKELKLSHEKWKRPSRRAQKRFAAFPKGFCRCTKKKASEVERRY